MKEERERERKTEGKEKMGKAFDTTTKSLKVLAGGEQAKGELHGTN
jgi:hypothetical protein